MNKSSASALSALFAAASKVDDYVAELLAASDPALDAALKHSDEAGLPTIQVSPAQGKLLHLLARACGARSILEIGTLGGYSTIWLARALPSTGRVVTLEAEPKHAEVARANLERAGLSSLVDIRLGLALDTLSQLADEQAGPFDFVFIDADKVNTAEYFRGALKLCRTGGMIVADNVVRGGELANEESSDPNVLAMRRFHEVVAQEPRVSATTIQTVGCKGYDGLTIAVVLAGD